LRGIDSNLDVMVIQNPANNGTLTTVGSLGVDASDLSSFDISSGGNAFAGLTLAGGTNTGFYTIDLTTGAATLVGIIGATTTPGGETVTGIAVAPALVDFARAGFSVKEGHGPARTTVIRTGDTSGTVGVNVAAAAGSASAYADFTPTTRSLTFAAGETSKVFVVRINDGYRAERQETVRLTLSTPTDGAGATPGRRAFADLTIVDDDFRDDNFRRCWRPYFGWRGGRHGR
jgi:hypothetical protein